MTAALIPVVVWQALFVTLSLFGWFSAFYWARRYRELREATRLGGSERQPAFTVTSLTTGTPLRTGEATAHPTTEAFKLMSELGTHSVRWDFLETLPTLPQVNRPLLPGKSGLRVVEGGADSGPTPPESAA